MINDFTELKLRNWSQINWSEIQKSLELSGAQYQNSCRVVESEEEEEEINSAIRRTFGVTTIH